MAQSALCGEATAAERQWQHRGFLEGGKSYEVRFFRPLMFCFWISVTLCLLLYYYYYWYVEILPLELVVEKLLENLPEECFVLFFLCFFRNLRPHPNCVTMFGVCSSLPVCIVTEFVEGGNVEELIMRVLINSLLFSSLSSSPAPLLSSHLLLSSIPSTLRFYPGNCSFIFFGVVLSRLLLSCQLFVRLLLMRRVVWYTCTARMCCTAIWPLEICW